MVVINTVAIYDRLLASGLKERYSRGVDELAFVPSQVVFSSKALLDPPFSADVGIVTWTKLLLRFPLPFQHAWEKTRPGPQSFQQDSGVHPRWLSFVSASP